MKTVTEVLSHSAIVLLTGGIVVKINDCPCCWGPPATLSRTPGGSGPRFENNWSRVSKNRIWIAIN